MSISLTPHFTLDEASASGTAIRLKLDNSIPPELLGNARRTCNGLELIRMLFCRKLGRDTPLLLHSLFRSPIVNKAVGGSPTSYHLVALAADFDPPAGITHDEAQHMIAADPEIPYDLVMEEGTAKPESEGGSRWIHVQFARLGEAPRRLVRDALVDRLGGKIIRTAAG